jgi:hypothetical protein
MVSPTPMTIKAAMAYKLKAKSIPKNCPKNGGIKRSMPRYPLVKNDPKLLNPGIASLLFPFKKNGV